MIEEEKEEEEALHPDSHQCEQVLHIGREKKKNSTQSPLWQRENERSDFSLAG